MINYPYHPEKLLTIEEIAAKIQSGEYSSEHLLMHLCHLYDWQNKKLENIVSVHNYAMKTWRDESPV